MRVMMPGLQGSGLTSDPSLPSFTWDGFCHLLDRSTLEPLRSLTTRELPAWLTSSGQYFFETHSQKRAIETLCIKLALLNQLCVLVAEEHECNGRSWGVIDPEHVLIQVPEQRPSILPVRWRAQVSLAVDDQNRSSSFENIPAEMASSLALLPDGGSSIYAASLVREWPLGRKVSVTALVQSVDPVPDDDQTRMKGLIRVHVIADNLHAREFSGRDVFRVSLPSSESRGPSVEFWARKVEAPERGIIVSGLTDAVSLDAWNTLTRAVGTVQSSAEIAVYRAASPAHDVYSCGMLLLRALLGADEQRWKVACERLPVIVEGLQPVVQGLDNDHYSIHVRVRDRLRESADCFEAGNLPEVIWWDALVAVLRACSSLQGFSYARETTGYELSPARLLARELESLVRRTRIELFEAGERDAMILLVCDRAMDRLAASVS